MKKNLLTLLLCLAMVPLVAQWTEMGHEISPNLLDAGGDLFGHAVAMDGNIAVVGSHGSSDNLGVAYVYEFDAQWSLIATLSSSDGVAGDIFGVSIAIDDNIIVVGAYGHNGTEGTAYVFEKPVGGWADAQEDAKLEAVQGSSGDRFGSSVDVDNGTIVIGAPTADYTDLDDAGLAYVFQKDGTWVQQARLSASDALIDDRFGQSVAISGNQIVVGAPNKDVNGLLNAGQVYQFHPLYVGGGWSDVAERKITANVPKFEAEFGFSVDIHDGAIIVGAPKWDGFQPQQGAAHIFEKVNGLWSNLSSIYASVGRTNQLVGYDVSISEDFAAVGVRGDYNTPVFGAGAVYVKEKQGDTWSGSITHELVESSPQEDAFLGTSVAVSGKFIIAGAPNYDIDVDNQNSGRVLFLESDRPTVEITAEEASPTKETTFSLLLETSEEVSGFDIEDLIASEGTLSNFQPFEGSYYVDLTLEENFNGTVTINVPAGSFHDLAENANLPADELSIEVDTTPPTVLASSESNYVGEYFNVDVQLSEENFSNLSESIEGISFTNCTLENYIAMDGSNQNYRFSFQAIEEGEVTVQFSSGVFRDEAGNAGFTSDQLVLTYDATPPTVSISNEEPNPTSNNEVWVYISFPEEVTGLTVEDLVLDGATFTEFEDFGNLFGSHYSYGGYITSTTSGTKTLSVPAGAAFDLAGNPNEASFEFSIDVDLDGPIPVIESTRGPITNQQTVLLTVNVAEAIEGFGSEDLTLTNATLEGFSLVNGTYLVEVAAGLEGMVTVDIPINSFTDEVGNPNPEATYSYTYDITAPAPELLSEVGSSTTSPEISVMVALQEPVDGFDLEDITVVGGTASNLIPNSRNFQFTVTASEAGDVEVSIPAESFQDLAGNLNFASNTIQYEYIEDVIAPVVTIGSSEPDQTNSNPMIFTISFSEEVSGFGEEAIAVTNGTINELIEQQDGSYNLLVTPSEDGLVTVSMDADAVLDVGGNGNSSASLSRTYDSTAPSVTLSSRDALVNGPFDLIVELSEANVLEIEDYEGIVVTNGSITDNNEIGTDGNGFVFRVEPEDDGAVTVSFEAGYFEDAAGNASGASNEVSVNYDGTSPKPVLSTEASIIEVDNFAVLVTLDEDVSGFALEDITVNGGSASNFTDNEDNTYSFDVKASAEGEIKVSIAAAAFTDLAGNENVASEVLTVEYEDNALGLSSVEEEMLVYPNPFSHQLTLRLNRNYVGTGVINIYALDGRLVTTQRFTSEEGEISLDLSGLESGTYLLESMYGPYRDEMRISKR